MDGGFPFWLLPVTSNIIVNTWPQYRPTLAAELINICAKQARKNRPEITGPKNRPEKTDPKNYLLERYRPKKWARKK